MYIKVKVKTESKKELFERIKENTFSISVKVEAKNNWVNEKVMEILKKELNKKDVRLIAGHISSNKLFSVED